MSTQITGGDLKSILLSKRANLYYLEYCRVLCNGGRVEFVTGRQSTQFWVWHSMLGFCRSAQ